MDLIILLAVFVAFLALAYVTYRNVYNLDSRLRKIEDILKNAQVVAEPTAIPDEAPQAHLTGSNDGEDYNPREQSSSLPNSAPQEMSPYAGRYGAGAGDSFSGPVAGWGGEGGIPPKVTVAKEDADTRTIEVIPDDADIEGDTGVDGDDEGDSDDDVEVDDILDEMEREGIDDSAEEVTPVLDVATVRVADLKRALKNANVTFPSGAKKADLVRLVQDNNVSVQKGDGNEHGEEDDA